MNRFKQALAGGKAYAEIACFDEKDKTFEGHAMLHVEDADDFKTQLQNAH